jgi:hypothetical protein
MSTSAISCHILQICRFQEVAEQLDKSKTGRNFASENDSGKTKQQ